MDQYSTYTQGSLVKRTHERYNLAMAKKSPTMLRVPYGQAVHGEEEKKRVVQVLDEHRTIMGKEIREFEERVAKIYNKKFGVMVNSGSSAILLALELLDLPEGSEIITPLLTFATTVGPIVMKKHIPVFADVEEGTYNINVDQIEDLITKKTKALIIPLLLGNASNLIRIRDIAKKHNLYFIEDSCDTLGATYKGKPTGTYSDISITSFYGSHIITAGGGGGILMMNRSDWRDRARVLRGWGRSSSLFSESEDINIRFKGKLGSIPYDAKFIFDEIGYNFLPMEIGAAFGNAQLKRLPSFRKIRERNFADLYSFFKKYEQFFILPKQHPQLRTQWLAFPLTLREKAPFQRLQLAEYLEKANVQTRPIFTGNILKQPGFAHIKHRKMKNDYKITEAVMRRGIVVGCHHGLEKKHINRIKDVFGAFLRKL